MDFIRELGPLALGTRIKNLSDTLMKDMVKVYKDQNLDFEPRWFTFFQLILKEGQITITEIAGKLKQTHPSVVQVVNALEIRKLVESDKDHNDNRKRIVRLTNKGKQLAKEMAPLWKDVEIVAKDILHESVPGFLDNISDVEIVLQRKSTYQRIRERVLQRIFDESEFADYSESYFQSFQQINRNWLQSYLELTEYDRKVLSDPHAEIINKNGHIVLLKFKKEVIGTYALKKINNGAVELLKFTVKEKYRRGKIGSNMLEHALEKAKSLNYKTVLLFTAPELIEATNLYRKYGFKVVLDYPDFINKSARKSIMMQLSIG
ncbi:MAG: bifunctional helix-turn-helix transcriptional regulator/GNAT family N-acetyltransferase [Bacteroidales bacterium]|nr:bifunctional helix-turn-helix transcriptional regulator/GNAT family N-acetyltransferase [Bacteroidales bacterium]